MFVRPCLRLRLAIGRGAPALLKRLVSPGIKCEVWTVHGEAVRLEGVHLKTPDNLETLPVGQPLLKFNASTTPPDFRDVQKIVLNNLSTTWLGSRPDRMEYYRLGTSRSSIPPPPDWQRGYNQSPTWKRAQGTREVSGLPFLNHGIFCWAPAGDSNKDVSVYLFRQSFPIEHPETIARATLRLASNAEPQEAALNEYPLHLASRKTFSIGEFEVTPLLRTGDNIFAVRVVERPGIPAASHGLAVHLEIVRRDNFAKAPVIDPSAALLASKAGDRLWGTVQDLRGDRLLFNSTYGYYGLDWESCRALLFPAGWSSTRPRERWRNRFADPQALDNLHVNALPLAMQPERLNDCMLLSDGRLTKAKPSYMRNETLYFEGAEGKQFEMPVNEVLGIFPPRSDVPAFKRPQLQIAVLYSQLTTNAGEVVTGLLRELNSERVILETAGGRMLTIKTGWVASIQFPYHAAVLGPDIANGTIGLLPQTGGRDEFAEAYNTDAQRVQSAAFSIGADCPILDPEDLADTVRLSPHRMAAFVSVDPLGEYLHTVNAPGDAQNALASYVEDGGVIIALSRGGAFRAPVRKNDNLFVAIQEKAGFSEIFGLKAIHPSDRPAEGVIPFDHPPNTVEQVFFQRSGFPPKALAALPRRVELAAMTAAPFYPMVSRTGRGQVIYELFDAAGVSYGPALTIVTEGLGRLVIIDYLLWESRIGDQPFSERVLPILLHWALAA